MLLYHDTVYCTITLLDVWGGGGEEIYTHYLKSCAKKFYEIFNFLLIRAFGTGPIMCVKRMSMNNNYENEATTHYFSFSFAKTA